MVSRQSLLLLTVSSFTLVRGTLLLWQLIRPLETTVCDLSGYLNNSSWTQPSLGIRANPSAGTTGFTDGINSAILRYSGADDEEPTTIQNTEGTTLDEADLHPLENPGAVSNYQFMNYFLRTKA